MDRIRYFFFEILPFVLEFIKMQRDEFFSGFKQVSLAATICQIVTWARDQDQSFSSRGRTASSKDIMPSLCNAFGAFFGLFEKVTLIFPFFYTNNYSLLRTLAEVFYYVNYVNVNYSFKNSTVDSQYLLFLQDFFFRLKLKQYM